MLDQSMAQLMQRLLEKDASSTPLSATARRLREDLGIGRIQGKTLYLSERNRLEMRELLLARGYSATPLPIKDMSRSVRLAMATPNEKAGGGALKTGRVSMKALPNKTLNVGGRALSLPDGCHVDSDWRRVANGIGHDSIMLIENYEVFDQLHELAFDLPDDCKNPLVLYRGDKTESRLNNVNAFIDASDLPVLAFVDIDPKGLHIAVGYPRLIGVVAPDYADLKATMDSPASARPDLYRLQLPGVGDYLRSIADNSPISALWQLLQQHRAGVVQERWLVAGFKLVLWDSKRLRRV